MGVAEELSRAERTPSATEMWRDSSMAPAGRLTDQAQYASTRPKSTSDTRDQQIRRAGQRVQERLPAVLERFTLLPHVLSTFFCWVRSGSAGVGHH